MSQLILARASNSTLCKRNGSIHLAVPGDTAQRRAAAPVTSATGKKRDHPLNHSGFSGEADEKREARRRAEGETKEEINILLTVAAAKWRNVPSLTVDIQIQRRTLPPG